MARNASGYRHDHRTLRRKRGQWAFNERGAREATSLCPECWATQFTCPCCGPCVDVMVMTTKCCLFCGEGLVRHAPTICRYHRTADFLSPADTIGEGE